VTGVQTCALPIYIRASGSYRKEMVEVLTYRGLEKARRSAEGGKP